MPTKLIKHTTGILTHKSAQEYLNLPQIEGERAIKDQRVAEYVRRINEGLMVDCCVDTAIVPVKGKPVTFKLNGQHSCTALLKSSKKSLQCTFRTYEFDDMQAYARHYSMIDDIQAVRTTEEVIRAAVGALPADASAKESLTRVRTLALSAITFHAYGDNFRKINRSIRLNGFTLPFAQDFIEFCNKLVLSTSRLLMREPTFCAMLETWNANNESAYDFWFKVRDAANLDRDDPCLVLHKYLAATSCAWGKGAVAARRSAPWKEMFAKCIHAWNTYRTNGKMLFLKWASNAGLPKPI